MEQAPSFTTGIQLVRDQEEEGNMAAQMNPATAVNYGEFIVAAYSMYENDPNNLNPPKSSDFPRGYDLVATIQMADFVGLDETRKFYGFIAVSTSSPTTWVLAIRGTATLTEWWDDFHWELVPYTQVAGGGNVAEGFVTIYKTLGVMAPGQIEAESEPSVSFAADVARVLQGATGISDATTIQAFATGHSLGAALVSLFVLDAATTVQLVPNVYTFASPRVGDTTFVDSYDGVYAGSDVTAASWRIDNEVDIVPDFPPELGGYRHVSTASYITTFGTIRWTIPCAHALNSYLHVLNPDAVPLDSSCQPVVAEVVAPL